MLVSQLQDRVKPILISSPQLLQNLPRGKMVGRNHAADLLKLCELYIERFKPQMTEDGLTMSKEMEARFHYIRSPGQYKKVEKLIDAETRKYGFLTWDVEMELTTQEPVMIQAATLTGHVLIFELRSDLWGNRYKCQFDLPEPFLKLLGSEDVYVVGSDPKKDVIRTYGAANKDTFAPYLDTQVGMQAMEAAKMFWSSLNGRTGFDELAYQEYGIDGTFKPRKKTHYAKAYGAIPKDYRSKDPKHRHFGWLYNWQLPPSKTQRAYLYTDAVMPCVMVWSMLRNRLSSAETPYLECIDAKVIRHLLNGLRDKSPGDPVYDTDIGSFEGPIPPMVPATGARRLVDIREEEQEEIRQVLGATLEPEETPMDTSGAEPMEKAMAAIRAANEVLGYEASVVDEEEETLQLHVEPEDTFVDEASSASGISSERRPRSRESESAKRRPRSRESESAKQRPRTRESGSARAERERRSTRRRSRSRETTRRSRRPPGTSRSPVRRPRSREWESGSAKLLRPLLPGEEDLPEFFPGVLPAGFVPQLGKHSGRPAEPGRSVPKDLNDLRRRLVRARLDRGEPGFEPITPGYVSNTGARPKEDRFAGRLETEEEKKQRVAKFEEEVMARQERRRRAAGFEHNLVPREQFDQELEETRRLQQKAREDMERAEATRAAADRERESFMRGERLADAPVAGPVLRRPLARTTRWDPYAAGSANFRRLANAAARRGEFVDGPVPSTSRDTGSSRRRSPPAATVTSGAFEAEAVGAAGSGGGAGAGEPGGDPGSSVGDSAGDPGANVAAGLARLAALLDRAGVYQRSSGLSCNMQRVLGGHLRGSGGGVGSGSFSSLKRKVPSLMCCRRCGGPHPQQGCYRRIVPCTYDLCLGDKRIHAIEACMDLHRVCSGCCTRGHRPSHPRCPKDQGDEVFAEMRDHFERFADAGIHTREREQDPHWGYFHFGTNSFWRRYPDGRFPYTYAQLLSVPVSRVHAWVTGHTATLDLDE